MSQETVDRAVQTILSMVSDETDPNAGVSKREYLEIMEEVVSDLESRIDAVKSELEHEDERETDDGDEG